MVSRKNPSSKTDREGSVESDLNLVKAITSGSIPAWHEFINRYSGLIYSVVRRHLLADDDDEIRSAWTDTLKALYDGELAKYRGGARLSTWLIVSARSRTIDLLRHRRGRLRRPQGYETLGDFDKRVLQLFYVDRLPLEIVVQVLGWEDVSTSVDEIVESVGRIERAIDPRYLRRLDEDHMARKSGAGSIQVLRYLIQQEIEIEGRSGEEADHSLVEAEVLDRAKRLRRALSTLTPEERKVLLLRYGRGWSAREIAERLPLKGPRRVYAIIDRTVKRLRRTLRGGER
jgi:RNA polymerase sigma factor (sigma-70 family)